MSLDIVSLHKLIDTWAAEQRKAEEAAVAGEIASPSEPSTQPTATPEVAAEVAAKVLPVGKRVVRTKSSGDTVYFIDEVKNTRQRIVGTQATPGPQIVESLGFTMADVEEVDDTMLLKYNMSGPISRLADANA